MITTPAGPACASGRGFVGQRRRVLGSAARKLWTISPRAYRAPCGSCRPAADDGRRGAQQGREGRRRGALRAALGGRRDHRAQARHGGHVYTSTSGRQRKTRGSRAWRSARWCSARGAPRERRARALRRKPSLYVPRRGSSSSRWRSRDAGGARAAAAALAALKRNSRPGALRARAQATSPALPAPSGVVTSASGAAFHDIARAVHQRWPARIVLAPTLVRGPTRPRRS